MESRKAWRNRESSAGEGVLALLESLRDGLGAQSVGLFDDDRADPERPTGALNFWDAFDERPCADIDWEAWYRELRTRERVETTCGCGGEHRLCGYLIHERWALLLVAPPALAPGGAAAIASSLRALAARLPPGKGQADHLHHDAGATVGRTGDSDGGAAGDTPATGAPEAVARTGGLLWWVRKAPQ